MKFLYKRDWMDEEIVDAINWVLIYWQIKYLAPLTYSDRKIRESV